MKLLSSYIKEMKIAARGFYFYIEIFFAILLLVILLFAVKENPISKAEEFLYYDMPQEVSSFLIDRDISEGKMEKVEDASFKLKAISFDVFDKDENVIASYEFEDDTLVVDTYKIYDSETGDLEKTVYITDNEEDTIRLSYMKRKIGATVMMDNQGEFSYIYYNQGYETERYNSLLYVLHNESPDTLQAAIEEQSVRKLGDVETLNNRENLVPVFLVFMGSLMGFFIVMAYIFLDKAEGVIRAFAVTPSSVWKYLLSKTLVIITTVILSSSIIAIPVMGGQANYLLFYVFLIISTFAFAALGLLVASFFDSISKAFGALYGIMIIMMVPAFSYFIPSFDPVWLRIFPTYPMLQGFKEIIMVNTDVGYVLIYSGVFLALGLVVFWLANIRFKKTLTV